MNTSRWSATCATICIFFSTQTTAALIDNGGGFIYDDVLDITWSQPDLTFRLWPDTDTFVAGLTLGGSTDWRLPNAFVSGPSAIDCSTDTELACRDNEMGYMFYHNLGGSEGIEIKTSVDPDLALFPSLGAGTFFTSWALNSCGPSCQGAFAFNGGILVGLNLETALFGDPVNQAWAVHDGNVGPVPVPAAAWLFGSGLLGLIGVARRKKA